MFVRAFGGAALVAVTLIVGRAGAASAPPPVPGIIAGPSACPSPDAVWAELVTLVPRDRLEARLRAIAPSTRNGKASLVEIFDLGVPYRVLAGGQVREYRDDRRDCAARARVAAVFVALALDPAEIAPATPAPAATPTPPPVAPPAPLPPPVAEPSPPLPRTRIDLAGTVQAGLGPDQQVAQPGLALRWTSGRGTLAPTAGVTVLLPVDTAIGGVELRQWRLPVDAGARLRLGGRRVERTAEAGLCVAVLSESARDLASPRTQTGLEIGVRVAFSARLVTRRRLAPFASLNAELVPDPPAVFALPSGVTGHAPLLWLGASAGLSLGFL